MTTTPEAYVHLSADKTILTFYYDTLRYERGGTTWGIGEKKIKDHVKLCTWTGTLDSPNTSVFTAVFDASFRDFRPTTTNRWFYWLTSLKSIEGQEHLNSSQVTDMNRMFCGCSSLTALDLSSFDTSQVTSMKGMFYRCSSLTELDLSNFDTSQVKDMGSMFEDCKSLTTIYCNSSWSCYGSDYMFSNCDSLKGAVAYNASKTDVNMANPETGYFTKKAVLRPKNEAYVHLSADETILTL